MNDYSDENLDDSVRSLYTSVRMEDMRGRKLRRRKAVVKKVTATKSKEKSTEKPSIVTPFVVLNNPIEKPKFDGNNYSPMKFLTKFDEYSKNFNWDDQQKLRGVKSCLVKEAGSWADLFTDKWLNFIDFKHDFLGRFWSLEIQSSVRQSIEGDHWDRKKNPNMTNHFVYYVGLCKSLRPPMPEDQFISTIMKHFPFSVQTGWMFPGPKTLQSTMEYLLKQDNMFSRSKPGFEKRGKEYEVNAQTVDKKNLKRNIDLIHRSFQIKKNQTNP